MLRHWDFMNYPCGCASQNKSTRLRPSWRSEHRARRQVERRRDALMPARTRPIVFSRRRPTELCAQTTTYGRVPCTSGRGVSTSAPRREKAEGGRSKGRPSLMTPAGADRDSRAGRPMLEAAGGLPAKATPAKRLESGPGRDAIQADPNQGPTHCMRQRAEQRHTPSGSVWEMPRKRAPPVEVRPTVEAIAVRHKRGPSLEPKFRDVRVWGGRAASKQAHTTNQQAV